MTVPAVMHSRKGFNSFSDFSKFFAGYGQEHVLRSIKTKESEKRGLLFYLWLGMSEYVGLEVVLKLLVEGFFGEFLLSQSLLLGSF